MRTSLLLLITITTLLFTSCTWGYREYEYTERRVVDYPDGEFVGETMDGLANDIARLRQQEQYQRDAARRFDRSITSTQVSLNRVEVELELVRRELLRAEPGSQSPLTVEADPRVQMLIAERQRLEARLDNLLATRAWHRSEAERFGMRADSRERERMRLEAPPRR